MHSIGTHMDQATGLRQVAERRPVKVIAVTGGKGGIGKTNVSANLGLALVERGREVMLLDADLGLANVDVLLGLSPKSNLSHVLEGRCSLDDIIIEGPRGLQVVPASSGTRNMAALSQREHAAVIRAFCELDRSPDVLLVDTAAGLSDSVISFTQAAQQVIVVVCDEPASITDAYALIKVLSKDYGVNSFHVLANMTRNAREGRQLYNKISAVTDRFLDVNLNFLGNVPYDDYLKRAVQKQEAVVEAYPSSFSALAFKNLAMKTDKWAVPDGARGNVEFFVERLIQTRTNTNGQIQ